MFFGHIPAGYISTKILLHKNGTNNNQSKRYRWILFLGIVAGITPDFDIPYFYLIDNRQHLHHGYWTHLPIYWAGFFTLWFTLSRVFRAVPFGIYGTVVSVNLFLHLFLDTIVGKIRWLYPFSGRDFVFFHVPAVHKWWVANFVFHWTFLFEIALAVVAVYFFIKSRAHAKA